MSLFVKKVKLEEHMKAIIKRVAREIRYGRSYLGKKESREHRS